MCLRNIEGAINCWEIELNCNMKSYIMHRKISHVQVCFSPTLINSSVKRERGRHSGRSIHGKRTGTFIKEQRVTRILRKYLIVVKLQMHFHILIHHFTRSEKVGFL